MIKELSAKSKRVRPLFWDLGLTFVSNISAFIANLVVVSIIGRLLGPILLAEYLLVRRVIAWITAGQLGLGVGLPRYVAHAVNDHEGKQENYFLAGLLCLVVLGSLILAPLNAAPGVFSGLLFGDSQLKRLIVPLSIFLGGMMMHGVVYGYYRGRLEMRMANSIQAWNFAVAPITSVLVFFRTHSIGAIMAGTGGILILSSLLFAIPIFVRLSHHKHRGIPHQAWELLCYGIPRLPGDFSAGALYALGPVIAAHYYPLSELSYLLLGISILMAVGVSTAPLGMILLSKASMMLAQNRRDEVASQLRYLMTAVVELSTFGTLQIAVFADVLVRLWVGHAFSAHSAVIRIIVLAVPFFLLYTSVRSIIDAVSVKPYTARISITSLAVFLALTGFTVLVVPHKWMLEGIAASLLCAMIAMAVVTTSIVQRLYEVKIPWKTCAPSLLLSSLLAGIALFVHWSTGFQTKAFELAGLELIFLLIYIGALVWRRAPWLQYLRKAAFLPTPRVAMAPMAQ